MCSACSMAVLNTQDSLPVHRWSHVLSLPCGLLTSFVLATCMSPHHCCIDRSRVFSPKTLPPSLQEVALGSSEELSR